MVYESVLVVQERIVFVRSLVDKRVWDSLVELCGDVCLTSAIWSHQDYDLLLVHLKNTTTFCVRITSIVNNTMTLKKLLKQYIFEALDNPEDPEERIKDLCKLPEYKDVNAFVDYKLENEEFSYSFVDLQALARNATQKKLGKSGKAEVANPQDVSAVRRFLEDEMGFKLEKREPIKQVRGFTSNPNGTHPFAGQGAGGSGFGSSGFSAHGGGPGAIVDRTRNYDPENPEHLPMGSRRKK